MAPPQPSVVVVPSPSVNAGPLAHVEADFLRPLFFGHEVEVEVVLARLGKTSVTFGHRIRKGPDVTSTGVTSHVFVDGRTFQPVSVPDALRQLLEA